MRFSIVTPSFKQLDYLGCCIASVADQGVTVEHIVQDAGSPGIEEFAEKMAEQILGRYGGERVSNLQTFELLHIRTSHGYTLRIFKEKDEGMYDAINRGLQKATGEVCAYLNCDEQYLLGTLRRVADYFGRLPKIDVLFGAAIVVRPDGSYVCDRKVMKPTRLHTLVSGNLSIFTCSTFFRRRSVI